MDEIEKIKSFKEKTEESGVKLHILPMKPKDVEDDGNFHFVILGHNAASSPGNPSTEAKRFIEETTSADRPRVFRNSIILAVPSKEGLEGCRTIIRECLAWESVNAQLRKEGMDKERQTLLSKSLESSRKKISEMIQKAYSVVVTVGRNNEIQALKLVMQNKALFSLIKEHREVRIQDSAISAEALLPGGPYNLWVREKSLEGSKIWPAHSPNFRICQRCCNPKKF